MLFGASALILFSLKDRTPAAVWQTAVGVLSMKEEVSDDLVKEEESTRDQRYQNTKAIILRCSGRHNGK